MKKWTTRNPKLTPSPEKVFKHGNAYQTKDKSYKYHDCVYYDKSWQKAIDCKPVSGVKECKPILSQKKNHFLVVP